MLVVLTGGFPPTGFFSPFLKPAVSGGVIACMSACFGIAEDLGLWFFLADS